MSSCPLSTPNSASLSLLKMHPRLRAHPLALEGFYGHLSFGPPLKLSHLLLD